MDIEKFKTIALFAKENRIKRLKLDGIEIEFSELSFLHETEETKTTEIENEEDEDILYHSAGV